ncbi:hypothetical protein BZM27_54125 [Paraburkholderia steynii]|uniref:Uncharacterized protein n=1 Tax=Paraburkholderia steynii TaxID=1245441 RepID=A0A4R0X1U5_9BURK|nr:hypothetical protein BZM27_54125 [Paraburkholderia steynii]
MNRDIPKMHMSRVTGNLLRLVRDGWYRHELLRLLREIAAFSTGRQIGALPLKGLTRYELDS